MQLVPFVALVHGFCKNACIWGGGGLKIAADSSGCQLHVNGWRARVKIIDGADEVDLQLNCIKGGGACQLQEKIVAFAAKKFVVIADFRKELTKLGEQWTQGVPVEVVPMAYVPLMHKMEQDFGGKPVLRMAKCKAGPVVTDNGNFVLDVNFGVIGDPKTLCDRLVLLPGVVEVGLFCGMAEKAFFGQADGSFTTRVADE